MCRHYWIFCWVSYQLKSIKVITDGGKTGCDGERGSLEELDTRLVRDMNQLEKQLTCELKGTQLEAKPVRKAAVKSAIISPACACPKCGNWFLSFAFRTDNLVFLGGRSLPSRPATAKDLVRCRWSPSSLPWRSIQPLPGSPSKTAGLCSLCSEARHNPRRRGEHPMMGWWGCPQQTEGTEGTARAGAITLNPRPPPHTTHRRGATLSYVHDLLFSCS